MAEYMKLGTHVLQNLTVDLLVTCLYGPEMRNNIVRGYYSLSLTLFGTASTKPTKVSVIASTVRT